MNEQLKAFKEIIESVDVPSEINERIPLINFSMLDHIFSPLVNKTNIKSLEKLKKRIITNEEILDLKNKLKFIKNEIYFKTTSVFILCNFLINRYIFNKIGSYFISTSRGFNIYNKFKFLAVPLISSIFANEYLQGTSIDLNSYLPMLHPYYNLVYFDVHYKTDMIDLRNINSLDNKKYLQLLKYSSSVNKNKKEIENILNFFVIKYHYVLFLTMKKVLQAKGNNLYFKPFNDSIYDIQNTDRLLNKIQIMGFIKQLIKIKKIEENNIPTITLDLNNIKEMLDMKDIFVIFYSHLKLTTIFKFVKEYKNLMKENKIIEEEKIDKRIQQLIETRIDNLSKLVKHDIHTSKLYNKYDMFSLKEKIKIDRNYI